MKGRSLIFCFSGVFVMTKEHEEQIWPLWEMLGCSDL